MAGGCCWGDIRKHASFLLDRIKIPLPQVSQTLLRGNQETDLWQGRVQGVGAVEGGRKPDALDCGAERKEGSSHSRAWVGGNAGRGTRWGSCRPGGEGGNHALTVRTTTGNWLPPYPESIHKQANFAVGRLYMDRRGTSIGISFPLRSIHNSFVWIQYLGNVFLIAYRVREKSNQDQR